MSCFKILIISKERQFWSLALDVPNTEADTVSYHQIVATLNVAIAYHLVIIDVEETARQITLCRKLRAVYEGAILVLTSDTDPEFQRRVYEAGADVCAMRSRNVSVIRAKIRVWLRRIDLKWPDRGPSKAS